MDMFMADDYNLAETGTNDCASRIPVCLVYWERWEWSSSRGDEAKWKPVSFWMTTPRSSSVWKLFLMGSVERNERRMGKPTPSS